MKKALAAVAVVSGLTLLPTAAFAADLEEAPVDEAASAVEDAGSTADDAANESGGDAEAGEGGSGVTVPPVFAEGAGIFGPLDLGDLDPIDPVDPVGPVDPVDPVDPTPVDPVDPVPVDPAPVDPVIPAPVNPGGSTNPSAPVYPSTPSTPGVAPSAGNGWTTPATVYPAGSTDSGAGYKGVESGYGQYVQGEALASTGAASDLALGLAAGTAATGGLLVLFRRKVANLFRSKRAASIGE